jgi:hypothetical protein
MDVYINNTSNEVNSRILFPHIVTEQQPMNQHRQSIRLQPAHEGRMVSFTIRLFALVLQDIPWTTLGWSLPVVDVLLSTLILILNRDTLAIHQLHVYQLLCFVHKFVNDKYESPQAFIDYVTPNKAGQDYFC